MGKFYLDMRGSKPKGRKPIHPGLEPSTMSDAAWCRKCNIPIEFKESFADKIKIGFCMCGLWAMDRGNCVRWIRFSSSPFYIGQDGPLSAP